MSDLSITELWFKRAKPEPTQQNFNTQLGVHLEEIVEMLDTLVLKSEQFDSEELAGFVRDQLHLLAENVKNGVIQASIKNRVEFLDSLADQIVTATGSGYMAGMNVPVALDRVNASNFSKFDDNGMPIFDANGKIMKGPKYQKVNLEGLV